MMGVVLLDVGRSKVCILFCLAVIRRRGLM